MENTAKLPFSAVRKHNQLFPPSFPDRPLFRRLTHKRHSRTLTFGSCMMNMTEETSICEHRREFHHEWTTTWSPGRSGRGCRRENQKIHCSADKNVHGHSNSMKTEQSKWQSFWRTFWMKLRCDQVNAQSFMACVMTNLCLMKPFTRKKTFFIYSVTSSSVLIKELIHKEHSFISMEGITLQ